MAKRPIPKALLDRAIELTMQYWHSASHPLAVEDIISLCMQIQDVTGINWFSLQNMLDSVFPVAGLKEDATNEDIYAILRLLGWKVSD